MAKYLCILDFEATCDETSNYDHEVIELPSVLLKINEDNEYVKVAEFQEYCKPSKNSKLTQFCTNLTGITQDKVDNGANFPEVLERHFIWLVEEIIRSENWSIEEMEHYMFKFLQDYLTIVTCGDWDLKKMMVWECKKWDLIPKDIYRRWINIKDVYQDVYGKKAPGMAKMLQEMEIELIGRHHSGIDDSNNIARIAQKLHVLGGKFTDPKYIKQHPVLIYKNVP